jgi:hypothetical protein
MDGQGSIQVNRLGEGSLHYRLIIKLLKTKSNYNMLIQIAKTVGGIVHIINKKTNII